MFIDRKRFVRQFAKLTITLSPLAQVLAIQQIT